MTPLKAFRIIKALTLHFKTDFSISKYGTASSKFFDAYSKLTDEKKRIYIWASEKFSTDQDLIFCVIGCFLEGKDIRFSDKSEVMEAFFSIKSRRESINYYLNEEYSKWESNGMPKLSEYIFKYLIREVSPEFILCLSEVEGDSLSRLYDDKNYTFISEEIFKLIKYKELFSYKKYIHILTTKEEELTS